MSNKVMQVTTNSPWRYIYGVWLWVLILSLVAYWSSFLVNIMLDSRIQTRQSQLQQVEDLISKIGSERAFFSYKFAESMAQNKWIKRSEQIQALITVLRRIQSNNSIGANAIQLSDFSVSPTELNLKGKVSNLILLYYSSEVNDYTNLIDRFAELPFITNIAIKKYNKVGNYYEFSLDADINPNVILEQNNTPQQSSSSSGEQLDSSTPTQPTTSVESGSTVE